MSTLTSKLTFSEIGSWEEQHYYAVEKILFSGKTQFQDVLILESSGYGKMLVLDGRIQSAQDDEHIYHESLVHPGMVAHPRPRKVLIIGGGEGATLREVLRHSSVERVVMVDIDHEVVNLCQKWLPEWSHGAFSDKRASVIYGDGKAFVEHTDERFDCVIIDVCDALEEGPALALYTTSFYQSVKKCLEPGGVVIVQAMELCFSEYEDHLSVRRRLAHTFRHVSSYSIYVPSFWCNWGFIVASDSSCFASLTPTEVDNRLRARRLDRILRHYDSETHLHMFSLPKEVRALTQQREDIQNVA